MEKLTKIIATIGPTTESPEMIKSLITAGVNVFRFNLKHNELTWHGDLIDKVKKIADEMNAPIGVLIDLQGPEIRITLSSPELEIIEGQSITVVSDSPKEHEIMLSHPQVIPHLKKGQLVSVDDGRFSFEVVGEGVATRVLVARNSGTLKTRKTFNIPGAYFPLPALTEKDRDAVKMGLTHKIDFIALSFVRTEDDILELREYMKEVGVLVRVVSKVETKLALDNLDKIIAVSEGIMVARGDLGIELPMEQVPYYQKIMIKKCLERGIPVITATQMLHSMTEKPYPTRAEISDIANAAYDLTDAVMLSEETAAGKYPLKAVGIMNKTVSFSEKKVFVPDTRALFDYYILGQEEMLCDAAYNLYLQLKKDNDSLGGFLVFTQTGRTARKLSRYRPQAPIFTFCPDEKARGGLTMSYGVVPFLNQDIFTRGQQVRIEDVQSAISFLRSQEMYDPKKHYIVLYGDVWMIEGKLSTIKVIPPQE